MDLILSINYIKMINYNYNNNMESLEKQNEKTLIWLQALRIKNLEQTVLKN
jgi:hypothetical protein